LSTGTLQLSIRCSSIHFSPSRSLPVSVGVLEGMFAAFGGGSSDLSSAFAGSPKQIASHQTSEGSVNRAMRDLVNIQVSLRRKQKRQVELSQ
jgi:hypothetical protein